MAVQLGDIQNALHNILLPYVRDNLPKQTILLDNFKRNVGVQPMNNKFYAAVRSTRHSGVTNLANDGDTTLSGTVGLAQANVSVKIVTGAFDISKLAIDATKSDKLSVVSALNLQTDKLMTDFKRSINRQMYGDSTGIVAQALHSSGSVGAGTISVMPRDANLDDGRSIDNYGTVNGDISPVKYLAPGMIIAVGSPGTALGTITSITKGASTGSIVVTGNPAINNDDAIYLVSGGGIGAGTMELTGIRAALSSTTGTNQYAAVARSTDGWQATFGSASEALTLGRIEQSYLNATEYASTGDTYIILMNKTLFRKYGDILTSMRRAVNQTELLGGWKGLEFAAGGDVAGVFLDFDVPDGEVLILNLDSWTLCEVGEIGWMTGPDNAAMLPLSNKIAWQATVAWFLEVLCLAPAANGRETQKTA